MFAVVSSSALPEHLLPILTWQLQQVSDLSSAPTSEPYLSFDDQILKVKCPGIDQSYGIDFNVGNLHHRADASRVGHEPLLKAVALKKYPDAEILDISAGMGRDAWLLAAAGAKVTLVEQHPILAALVLDALFRAEDQAIAANILSVNCSDAQNYLATSADVDIIYFDPMFPSKNKSALAKLNLQIIQQLVGTDHNDPETIFAAAKAKAKKRLVIKRPHNAEYYGNKKPSFSISSKQLRFDVYV